MSDNLGDFFSLPLYYWMPFKQLTLQSVSWHTQQQQTTLSLA